MRKPPGPVPGGFLVVPRYSRRPRHREEADDFGGQMPRMTRACRGGLGDVTDDVLGRRTLLLAGGRDGGGDAVDFAISRIRAVMAAIAETA